MSRFEDTLSEVTAAIALLPSDAESFTALSDTELTGIPAALAAARHQLEAREARVAGEIARRSSFDLGYAGLAQKTGFRTPEKLVQHLTGSTSREASKLVRAGVIIHEADTHATAEKTGEVPPELTKPWLASVGRAVATGILSLDAAEAIRIGLGTPTADISVEMLTTAATQLVELADPTSNADTGNTAPGNPVPLNADQLLDWARTVRDELDEAGIADREAARHQARAFKRYRRSDGMTVYSLTADPENAAYVDSIYDVLTSPRRGGPRLVDLNAKARDEAIETDPRSTEQLAFDGILAVLRIGADTDAKTATRSVLGARRPAVRVLVTQKTLETDHTGGSVLANAATDASKDRPPRCRSKRWSGSSANPAPPDHLRPSRANHRPRPGTTPLHNPTTHRPGCPRRRMPMARLRQAALLDGSPSHQPLAPRPRKHQCGRRNPVMPTPPHAAPQQPLGDHPKRRRLLAHPTRQRRP